MKRIVCLVQEHMFSSADIKAIEKGFLDIYKSSYKNHAVSVLWMLIPKGYAYAERKASEAAIIMVEVDEDIQQALREQLMTEFSQFLLNNYKVSPLDSVITVANSSFVEAFFQAQSNRIHPSSRFWIMLKMRWTALTSKISRGFLRLRVNY